MRPAQNGGIVIIFTFFAALILTIIPLPGWIADIRPDWTLLVLIYWCMALPERIGVGIGWLVGLFMDVTLGGLLGQHALTFCIIAYLTLKLHKRVRVFPLWQQALTVLILLALHKILMLWVDGLIGLQVDVWLYWLPSITSMLIWPVVYLVLRSIRRSFRVT
ncbi:MAG: rod shape-determining protein MreD [Gammaproteobacteria bacterium]